MKIKFVTWNINYGKRWQKAIELVKKLNPDVLALQEITSFFPYFGLKNVNVLEQFQKALPYLKYFCFAPVLKREKNGKIQQSGNALFSRYKIIDDNIVYFHHKPHWGERWWNNQAKNLLEAKVRIKEKELFVYSAHLNYFPFLLDTKKRLEETEKILRTVKNKTPFILAGDFNGKPNSKVVKKLNKVFNYVNPQNKATFKLSFSIGRLEYEGLQYKLDYIFHSSDLKVKNCQILDTKASDHKPIVVEFEIN